MTDSATRWLAENIAPDPSFISSALDEIQERLVQAGWTPPPRVFLEGQAIPSHLPVINNHGEVRDDYQDYDVADEETYTANYDVVEMNIDYDAAVARAQAARQAEDAPSPISMADYNED